MIVTAGCLLGLASCSDDDYKATELSTIKVLSAETSLQACKDTGYVVLDCAPMQAYVDAADQDWIKVEVKDDSVKFYAVQNESTESRNTKLTIKKSANDSIMMNVDQLGLIFIVQNRVDIVQMNDEAKSYHFNVKTDYVGEIVSTPDWVTADFTESRMNINFAENKEGHMREGYVTYRCGNFKDSLKVTQYDLQKDLLGDYYLLTGYDAKTDTYTGEPIPVTLKQNTAGAISMNLTALYNNKANVAVSFPVSFDEDSVSFSISSGTVVARYVNPKGNKTTYFWSVFCDPNGTYLPYVEQGTNEIVMKNTSGKITAYMTYDKKKGTYGFFSGMAYDESGYSAEFGSLNVGGFTTSDPYKKNLVNNEWWFSLSNIVLVKKQD